MITRGFIVTIGALCLSSVAGAQTLPEPGSTISLRTGQTLPVYGVRGQCGGEALTFQKAVSQLPKTPLVSYSDGGVGSRQSRSCGGAVAVRIINVTGKKAGTQQVNFYGDPFTLSVQ